MINRWSFSSYLIIVLLRRKSLACDQVFVGARLHVTRGALKGGRAVDYEAAVTDLDTAARVWLDRNGLVASSHSSISEKEDPSLEVMRRCRHSMSSIGSRLYVYGGLRGDVLLDDFTFSFGCQLSWINI